jgi:hypothetical protein
VTSLEISFIYLSLFLLEINDNLFITSIHFSLFKRVLFCVNTSNKIFNCWLELLEEVKDKDNSIEDILSGDKTYFKKQIDDGSSFIIKEHEVDLNIEKEQRVDVLLALENKREDIIINGAVVDLYRNPIEIYLQINPVYSVNNILIHRDYIEELAHHEAVHLVKFIQKLYQISSKGNARNENEQEWYNNYLTQKSEIHAYVSQLNNELKHIKLKYPDISFSESIRHSKIFSRYERGVFNKNPKLRNKMLSKLANYWNKI